MEKNKEELQGSFKTLNFWRTLYIFLIWAGLLLLLWITLTSEDMRLNYSSNLIFSVPFTIFIISLSVWTTSAVSKRKVNQITYIALINLLTGNLLVCLIMFSIRRVTILEHKNYTII